MGVAGAAVFAILWWIERRDRIAIQARLDAKADAEVEVREKLLREAIGAINAQAGATKEVAVGGKHIEGSLAAITEIVKAIASRIS